MVQLLIIDGAKKWIEIGAFRKSTPSPQGASSNAGPLYPLKNTVSFVFFCKVF